ncbi:MAG: hypothetical protein PHP42_09160 [Bacteroidota bacterium]|nr:hypothetical protein [Bacteroidota bacterium]
MDKYPVNIITEEMIRDAEAKVNHVHVHRTVASKIDTLTGVLGEYIFAEYFYKDWKKNRVGRNKGKMDFHDIEIKASTFPFSERLNLLVRKDYAEKRKPPFYILIIIDAKTPIAKTILPKTKAYLCGWATWNEVDQSPMKDMGSKVSDCGGYQCHYIPISKLHPMEAFEKAYREFEHITQTKHP